MRHKWLLLAATIVPIVYFVAFIAIIAAAAIAAGGDPEAGLPVPFGVLFGGNLLMILVIIGLTVVYIVDVFRNPRIPSDQRALWAVVIFMGNVLAMPIYWWIHIRPPRPEGEPAA